MSDNFRKFSESALLYAKYAAVVDEMWELFKADTTAFLDALRDRVQSQVRTGTLGVNEAAAGRSWYIEEEGTEEEEDVPYIWFRTQDAQIVTPGVLALGVYADGTLQPYRQQFATMLSELQLPSTCKKVAVAGGQIFAVTVTYGVNDDPVATAAEPILLLLTTLYDGWKKVQKPASKATPTRTSRKLK